MHFLIYFSDILNLNKQRLMAVEELKKAKREKEILLDRIEKLEEIQADAGKGDSVLKLQTEFYKRSDELQIILV